ncbi:hypothetical protein OPV22_024332 [Ensete ventricosum]|uniref:FLZ-type domain-containing protein n=1 Tax=Ensete ventricosum TaxID=4639 RepID=A0AAV8PDU3_ENSVE|nr:hypothetical protein OPV22_024332 [Ensete ventricosum]
MLSRNKGSIFHLGEDGVEITKTVVSIREPKHMRPASEGIEGLRILIHHKEQGSNVVTKSSCSLSKGGLGFLKSCFLCKRELSPSKDVYMYRGDLGFCSKECRSRQILQEERREFEMAARARLRAPQHRLRASARIPEPDRNSRIPGVA